MIETSARDRFVRTAARLFAERGYAATSVADIQTELGLTAGSGALYKHFPSKKALLEAVVAAHLDTMRAAGSDFTQQVPGDSRAALDYVADAVWASMQRDRDLIRVLLRDLDAHPDLIDELWSAVRSQMYDTFTAWIESRVAAGVFTVDDPAATSAVLLAALTSRPILDALISRVPGDVDAARYRAAWIEQAVAVLFASRRAS